MTHPTPNASALAKNDQPLLAQVLARLGRPGEAMAAVKDGLRARGHDAESLERLDGIFAAAGLEGVYREVAKALQARAVELGPMPRTQLELYADRPLAALDWLGRVFVARDRGLLLVTTDPIDDPRRHDRRFRRLEEGVGLRRPRPIGDTAFEPWLLASDRRFVPGSPLG